MSLSSSTTTESALRKLLESLDIQGQPRIGTMQYTVKREKGVLRSFYVRFQFLPVEKKK